jgi:type I restriction enzyme S subunit
MASPNHQLPSNDGKPALPKGWAIATIAELIAQDGIFRDGDWVESKDQDLLGNVRLIQLADVGDGVYRNRSNRYLTREKAIELDCTFLEPGDILIARMPDPLGRRVFFPEIRSQALPSLMCALFAQGGMVSRTDG